MIGIYNLATAVALLAACGWASYLIAARILPDTPASTRLAGATLIAYAIFYLSFAMLLAPGLFGLWTALPLILILAGALHFALRGAGAAALLRLDAVRLRDLARDFAVGLFAGGGRAALYGLPQAIILALLAAVVVARVLRGLVAPPLGWDALLYHLFRAGRWIQQGHDVVQAAPDTWGFCEYYPAAGDSFWSWPLLAATDGEFLAPAGLLIWIGLVLAAYSAARTLGARRKLSMLSALSIGFTPAIANALTAGYIDTIGLTFFLLAMLFTTRALATPTIAEASLAGLALGLATAVKVTMVPVMVIGWAFIFAGAFRKRSGWHRYGVPLAACAIGALLFLNSYWRLWLAKGSPFYPLPLTLFGRVLLRGDTEWSLVHSARLVHNLSTPGLMYLIWPFSQLYATDYLGLGPLSPAILILGVIGWCKAFARPGKRGELLFVLAIALVLAGGLFSPEMAGFRTLLFLTFGRFTMPVCALATVAAALFAAPGIYAFWWLVLLVDGVLSVPTGFTSFDGRAVGELVAPILVVGVLVILILMVGWQRSQRWAIVAAGVAALGLFVTLPGIRSRLRYQYYQAAAAITGPVYDMHLLSPQYASWELWAFLDDGKPHRIALTAGWDGIGDNWYLYPLLGSHLQNTVVYVPVTADGSVVNYGLPSTDLIKRADFKSWVDRLRSEHIDYVVSLNPPPPEKVWMDRAPETFTEVIGDPGFGPGVYTIHSAGTPPR